MNTKDESFPPKPVQHRLHPAVDSKDFIGHVKHSANCQHDATTNIKSKPHPSP